MLTSSSSALKVSAQGPLHLNSSDNAQQLDILNHNTRYSLGKLHVLQINIHKKNHRHLHSRSHGALTLHYLKCHPKVKKLSCRTTESADMIIMLHKINQES